MKTQLLCTFTQKNELDAILELIIACNDNSLLLTNDTGLNKIPTKIHSIVSVKDRENN